MESSLYTTLGKVAWTASENYRLKKQRMDFVDILRELDSRNELTSVPSVFRRSDNFLNVEKFRQHAYTQPVFVSSLFSNDVGEFIREDSIVPTPKDIYIMVHLPYIKSDMHQHDYFEINYVYKGSYTQIFESEKREFRTGSLIIIAPESPHIVHVNDESLIICINIRKSTFDKTFWHLLETNDVLSAFFRYSLYENEFRNYLSFQIGNTLPYEKLIQQIFDESNQTDDYSNTMAVSYINIFLGKLLREFGDNTCLFKSGNMTPFNADFPLIMRYVQHNYSTVSLSTLSQVFHYSEVYISKMFKKNLNQSFSCILQNIRLYYAKRYLCHSNYTLENIAHLVGYESSDYLSRIFKKKFHVTPSDFRVSAENADEYMISGRDGFQWDRP